MPDLAISFNSLSYFKIVCWTSHPHVRFIESVKSTTNLIAGSLSTSIVINVYCYNESVSYASLTFLVPGFGIGGLSRPTKKNLLIDSLFTSLGLHNIIIGDCTYVCINFYKFRGFESFSPFSDSCCCLKEVGVLDSCPPIWKCNINF